jgi:hypothetical protein
MSDVREGNCLASVETERPPRAGRAKIQGLLFNGLAGIYPNWPLVDAILWLLKAAGRHGHTLVISGTRDAITSRIEIAVDWNTRRRNCCLFSSLVFQVGRLL